MNTIVASKDTMTHTDAMSREISVVVDKMNARTVDSFKAAHDELDRLQHLVFLSAERVKIVLESHVTVAQTAQDHAEKIISAMAMLREEHKALGE